MNILKISTILCLALTGNLLHSSNSFAQQSRFALACINTNFQGTSFYYRWGNKPWIQTYIPQGNWMALSYSFHTPGQNHSPILQVMFDSDLTSQHQWTVINLEANAARYSNSCEKEGRLYSFWQNSYGFISLGAYSPQIPIVHVDKTNKTIREGSGIIFPR